MHSTRTILLYPLSPSSESISTRDSGDAARKRQPRDSGSPTSIDDASNGDSESFSSVAPATSSHRRVKRPKKKKKKISHDDIPGSEASNDDSETTLSLNKTHPFASSSKETPQLYSDPTFRLAAIQWLIDTNQPLQALNHPAFQKMVSIAARADREIKLPSREEIQKAIMERRGAE